MSAYIVDDNTINRIIAGFEYVEQTRGDRMPRPHGYAVTQHETPAELGQAMRDMNVKAVKARYPNDKLLPGPVDENGNTPDYVYHSVMPLPPVAMYKSIQWFLYQCTEGDIDDSDLYIQLDEYLDRLAHFIVQRLEAYEKAPWG